MSRTIRLALMPKQRRFFESTAKELLYSGAWGAGKSIALCAKVLALAIHYPGSTIGLCRKKMVQLKATTLRVFLREVCPPELIVNHHKTDHVIVVKAGPKLREKSEIHYFGLINEKGDSYNIRGFTGGAVGLDEAVETTEDEWKEIKGRLRDPKCGLRQIFAATNPAGKGHWLYQRMFINRDPNVHETIETNTLENPYLPDDYRADCERLTGRYRDRYVLGKWVDFEGLVYDHFDPLVHCITWQQFAERFGDIARDPRTGRPRIPPEWTNRYGVIDFGYTNPFVHQWWARSPDDEFFRYREIYHTRRLVSVHGTQIREQEATAQEKIVSRWADHDAEDRATLHAAGIATMPANKAKLPGIETVYELLTVNPVTGRPRMFFIREALLEQDPYLVSNKLPWCTEQELMTYAYPRRADGKPVREEPVKINDHGADCTRYFAHSLLKGGSGTGLLDHMRAEAARRQADEAARAARRH